MKNIKKASIVLLSFVILFSSKNIGKASNFEISELKSIETLRLETCNVFPYLDKKGDVLECLASIEGASDTTKIRISVTLEEKISSGWISLAGWVTTEYSSSLSAYYTYPRASSGKTYRLTVTADVTTNGRTETVSRSVTESF